MVGINPANIPNPLQMTSQFQNMSQQELFAVTNQFMQAFAALLEQDDEKKSKKTNPARAFLVGSGVFMVKPLDNSVKVNPGNDSEYWAALGYDA